MEKFNLANKRALITGGSRGIGLGMAKAFAEAGADVAIVSRSRESLENARAELADTGRDVKIYPFDMSDVEKIDSLYSKIIDDTGGVDILVNNAGGTKRGPAESVTLEDWNFIINLNLTSVFVLCQVFARERIKAKKGGKIVNIASLMTQSVRPDNAPYAASKGGIGQLTKSLAADWAKYNINVNAIGPGYIKTELTKPLWEDAKFDKWVRSSTPLDRWGLPDDIAYVAVFLASAASDFITAQVIYADGGWLSTL